MTIAITLAGWDGLSSEEEAVVINWFVRAGQKVESQHLLAEVMVEKINLAVSAPQAGTIEAILAPEGTIVIAGTTLALLNENTGPGLAEAEQLAELNSPALISENAIISEIEVSPTRYNKQPFVLASPAARRLAKELNLNLEIIALNLDLGTRINEAAVMNYLTVSSEANLEREIHAVPGQRQPQSRLRKLIRSRVSRATQLSAAVTLTRKLDVTGLISWLDKQNIARRPEAAPLTLLAAILKATGLALLDYPLLNSILDGDDVIYMAERNISLVLPLSEGVVLPVIHGVDKLTLSEIATNIIQLEAATRHETLHLKDTLGSTFTVSDLGSYGVDSFTPILNLQQAAILGVGRVATELVWHQPAENFRESAPVDARLLEPHRFITFSLTFDHRISDGPYSAAFLQKITDYLQEPELL